MTRKAPDPAAHLRQFMATVADYENLENAFPLTTELPFAGVDEHRDRWTLSLHAMVLRKYFASDDELRLAMVIESIKGCMVEGAQEGDRSPSTQSLVKPEDWTVHTVGEASRSESQIWTDRLYGRLLHGDYDKWRNQQSTFSNWDDVAVTMHTQALAMYVHDVARIVVEMEQLGRISFRALPGA